MLSIWSRFTLYHKSYIQLPQNLPDVDCSQGLNRSPLQEKKQLCRTFPTWMLRIRRTNQCELSGMVERLRASTLGPLVSWTAEINTPALCSSDRTEDAQTQNLITTITAETKQRTQMQQSQTGETRRIIHNPSLDANASMRRNTLLFKRPQQD